MHLFKKRTPSRLEDAIERLHDDMENVSTESPEYAQMADQQAKLYKLREHDSRWIVSPETLAAIAANLAGILIIVTHERAHVIATKAIGFVTRMK